MSKKSTDLSSEESALFRQAVKDAQPLKLNENIPLKPPRAQRSSVKIDHHETTTCPEVRDTSENLLGKIAPDAWLGAKDTIHFVRHGLSARQLNQLKRGQLSIEARLDLHRQSAEAALAATELFLNQCEHHGYRHVLVVHGKGLDSRGKAPVLKNLINQYLMRKSDVLAFSSAKLKDGGTGALYVLLKRKRPR